MEKKRNGKLLRIILLVLGLLLVAYSGVLLSMNNFNLGNALPGLFGLPLLIYGIFAPFFNRWFRHGVGKVVKWIFIAGYLFLIAVFSIFSIIMVNAAQTSPPENADAVLVLGAALKGKEPSDTLARRLDTAMEYARRNPDAVIVVSGGQGPQEDIPEAHAMREYLISHGIDESRILVEDQSRNTHQNFANSKEILDERFGEGTYSTVFVTNDFHILRGYLNAEHVGMTDVHGLAWRTLIYTAPPAYMRESLALLATYVFGVGIT
ncbi:YdcF family protein [Christensenella tenuis]|uniref:YdcF family protein n=1 Tax=Christensenella tenuis TaxID=2763033 RepID=A0ABR7EIT7_9FIRM|nr:YdcF family protein [Christensenella tenuis]MBC5648924.1 YdcF family protein [Christensenella tenuis]